MILPYQWQPKIVATHLAMVGNVVLAGIPGEFSTMSGRRMREAVKNAIQEVNRSFGKVDVIVAGLCNTYSDYITTPEEYQVSFIFEEKIGIFGASGWVDGKASGISFLSWEKWC